MRHRDEQFIAKMENLYRQNPGFRDKFKAVITSDLVTFSKPHPQPYLLGAKAIGVSPENCFVFEDSLSGIESGKAAGATVIGLATTLPMAEIKGKPTKPSLILQAFIFPICFL